MTEFHRSKAFFGQFESRGVLFFTLSCFGKEKHMDSKPPPSQKKKKGLNEGNNVTHEM